MSKNKLKGHRRTAIDLRVTLSRVLNQGNLREGTHDFARRGVRAARAMLAQLVQEYDTERRTMLDHWSTRVADLERQVDTLKARPVQQVVELNGLLQDAKLTNVEHTLGKTATFTISGKCVPGASPRHEAAAYARAPAPVPRSRAALAEATAATGDGADNAMGRDSKLYLELLRLRKFKAYTHRKLDEMNVPTHPPGPHLEQGCRIGQRLAHVQEVLKVGFEESVGLRTELTALQGRYSDLRTTHEASLRKYSKVHSEIANARAITHEDPASKDITYLRGYANGIELCAAILDERTPQFFDASEKEADMVNDLAAQQQQIEVLQETLDFERAWPPLHPSFNCAGELRSVTERIGEISRTETIITTDKRPQLAMFFNNPGNGQTWIEKAMGLGKFSGKEGEQFRTAVNLMFKHDPALQRSPYIARDLTYLQEGEWRMGDLQPWQQDDAHELWIRDQMASFKPYYQEKLNLLLRKIATLREAYNKLTDAMADNVRMIPHGHTVIDTRTLSALRHNATAVPDGYSLVPTRMALNGDAIDLLVTLSEYEDGSQYGDTTLWVGTAGEGDEACYGLHVSVDELLDEGASTLVEFPKP